MKSKRILAKLLITSLIATTSLNTLTVTAASKTEHSQVTTILTIKNYLSFENNQFSIDKTAMLNDGYTKEEIDYISSLYSELNSNLANENIDEIQHEKDLMLAELGATERGKLSAAVKVIKKFLKKNWPKIVKKLPAPVKKILTAEAILTVIDSYVGISDSVEELLTNCINSILPAQLEVLTPGIVTVIMLFLPL